MTAEQEIRDLPPETDISASDPYERQRVSVLDSEIAYVDTGGDGDPVST